MRILPLAQKGSSSNVKLTAFTNELDYIIKGKYKLMNYLKGGGFGDIFFAKHVEKNYEVAIKFVSTYFPHLVQSSILIHYLHKTLLE